MSETSAVGRVVAVGGLWLLVATGVLAQPVTTATTRLAWDHDGVGVTYWQWEFDGNKPIVIEPTKLPATDLQAASTGSWVMAWPALPPGTHTVTVSACNDAGCGTSSPFVFRYVVAPDPPARLRQIP